MTTLFDYQTDYLKESQRFAGGLFWGCGSGKTIMALHKLNHHYAGGLLLIVCLKSKIKDWAEAVEQETSFIRGKNCLIVNFEQLHNVSRDLEFGFIIVDESHKITNLSARVAKAFMYHALNPETQTLFLSATPYANILQMYIYLRVFRLISISYPHYRQLNTTPSYSWQQSARRIPSDKNREKYETLLKDYVHYYNYVPSYGEPRFIEHPFKPSQLYVQFAKDKLLPGYEPSNAAGDFLYLRTLLSGFIKDEDCPHNPRLDYLVKYLQGVKDQHRRTVIYCNYIKEIEHVAKACTDLDIMYSVVDGAHKELDEFLNEHRQVLIANYKSLSTGCDDLKVLSEMALYSPPLSYVEYVQTLKRIDRIGQTTAPTYHILLGTRSIDQRIWSKIKKGQSVSASTINAWMKNRET